MGDSAEKIVSDVRARLGAKLLGCEVRSPKRLFIEVAPKDLRETARYLWGERRCRFNTASGLQTRTGFEVLYHFSFNEGDEGGSGGRDALVLSVRVRTVGLDSVLPSVTPEIKAFSFIERELYDLLGIRFEGHPDPKPLLRAEDWPDDFFPMRRTEKRAELDYEGADRAK
jgi:NADH-quinone oxidoreductase subunit C